ncbi:hypothetical protein GCM10027601_39220 [Nocardioides ungokensis]
MTRAASAADSPVLAAMRVTSSGSGAAGTRTMLLRERGIGKSLPEIGQESTRCDRSAWP